LIRTQINPNISLVFAALLQYFWSRHYNKMQIMCTFLVLQFDLCGSDCRERTSHCQLTIPTSWHVKL